MLIKVKKANVVSINERAIENLQYIRETMERAGSFTAVPGWGGILMGISALLTALISSRLPSNELWVASWLCEAALALAVGGWAIVPHARVVQSLLLDEPGRTFVFSLSPEVVQARSVR